MILGWLQTKDEHNQTLNILTLMLISEDLVKNPKICREILRLRKLNMEF